MLKKIRPVILIIGAGDLASGVAWKLYQSHLRFIIMTEIFQPVAVRRTVSFCEAVYQGWQIVEGVTAIRIDSFKDIEKKWLMGIIPILVDPNLNCLKYVNPDIIIEATIRKYNPSITKYLAPLVIALGPGFRANENAHIVIETRRSYELGRIYYTGFAKSNTGTPAQIGGFSNGRLLRAPIFGKVQTMFELGDIVEKKQKILKVSNFFVEAEISGMLRGLIRSGIIVHHGDKVGDIDPQKNFDSLYMISDKARVLGGIVLSVIIANYNF